MLMSIVRLFAFVCLFCGIKTIMFLAGGSRLGSINLEIITLSWSTIGAILGAWWTARRIRG